MSDEENLLIAAIEPYREVLVRMMGLIEGLTERVERLEQQRYNEKEAGCTDATNVRTALTVNLS
jgi:hypothetical protein